MVRDYSDLIFILRISDHNRTTMTQFNLQNDDSRTRIFFLIVFYASAVGMIMITSYGLYISAGEYFKTGRIVIGEVLVNTEFPFSGFAKLVTYLMILSVLTWYCVTKIGGEKVINIPYPNPETPWNLVFATKMNLAAFLISAHAFYKISKLGEKHINLI